MSLMVTYSELTSVCDLPGYISRLVPAKRNTSGPSPVDEELVVVHCHCETLPDRYGVLVEMVKGLLGYNAAVKNLSPLAAREEIRHFAQNHLNPFRLGDLSIDLRNRAVTEKRAAFLKALLGARYIDDPATQELFPHLLRYYTERGNIDVGERLPTTDYPRAAFIRWSMKISLNEDEITAVSKMDDALTRVVNLTDHYYGWEIDQHDPVRRSENWVDQLASQRLLTPEDARTLLRGQIGDEEDEFIKEKLAVISKGSPSIGVARHILGIERYIAGNCYMRWEAAEKFRRESQQRMNPQSLLTPIPGTADSPSTIDLLIDDAAMWSEAQ